MPAHLPPLRIDLRGTEQLDPPDSVRVARSGQA